MYYGLCIIQTLPDYQSLVRGCEVSFFTGQVIIPVFGKESHQYTPHVLSSFRPTDLFVQLKLYNFRISDSIPDLDVVFNR